MSDKFVDFTEFEDEDGRTDWAAFARARERNGETCCVCHGYAGLPTGAPRQCASCLSLKEPGAVFHERLIRCPACGDTQRAFDADCDSGVLAEGAHEVSCEKCDTTFLVETRISHLFTSPARTG